MKFIKRFLISVGIQLIFILIAVALSHFFQWLEITAYWVMGVTAGMCVSIAYNLIDENEAPN